MTTGREHAARLTEMAVRAQEAAEWAASQDATDAMYEKYKADVQDLRRAVQERTRERDTLRQELDAATDARRVADLGRETMRKPLAETIMALGDPGGAAYADLPRLVRELREERDRLRSAAPDACNQCARRAVAAEREFAELRKALWGVIRGKATLGADDMNRLMSLSFYDPDTAEPASREPGCSNECSEMHTYELSCDLATEDAGRVCGSDKCDGDCCEPASREPETPGFKPGNVVRSDIWNALGTVLSCVGDSTHVRWDDGQVTNATTRGLVKEADGCDAREGDR